ncbi:MAG: LysR family transcriptional regulator [SAR86 cluster bacterium]|nr:LysR family transcriptional regulator [SAR86 cluster bacterium]
MNLNNVDLNLFIAFDIIYTEGNLTKAGKILGITQPAVSNALLRLRETFNDELFIRTSNGMTPTPAAQNIILDVRQALSLLRNSVAESERFDPVTAKTLFRIAIGDTSEYRLLPSLLKELGTLAPEVDIESFSVPRKETPRELAAGNIDFAIDPPIHNESSLNHSKIYEDKYVIAVKKNHPLVKLNKITLEDYLSLSHIHISSRRKGLGHVDLALAKIGTTRRIVLRAQHFLVAPYILDQSNLVMTTSKGFAQSLNLKTLELPFKVPKLELHLYWHSSRDADPANRWMRNSILSAYGNIFKNK